MQRRRNSGNSPSFLQEEELSSLRIGFVYKTLSCYARRYIAFTVFSRIEEKVKSHWIVIDSVKRACLFLNSFVGRLLLQFSASDIFGSYGRPEGVGCRAHKLRKNAKNHARPTPSHSKKKFRNTHAR